MNDADRQLVDTIVQAVMAALRQGGVVSVGPPGAQGAAVGGARADVQPPLGTCTGDYSKFPELAGRLTSAPPPSLAPAPGPLPAPRANPLRRFGRRTPCP